jgi:hypothetical protein
MNNFKNYKTQYPTSKIYSNIMPVILPNDWKLQSVIIQMIVIRKYQI